jgi:glycosyltransferase involved in cell wall biosynthesis
VPPPFLNIKRYKLIYAQIVGRNESSRYLSEVLERLSSQVDRIIFTDDCSDDNTAEIASKYAEVFVNSEQLFNVHEGKLRSLAWSNLSKFAKDGDWVIAIDCDEMLHHVDDINIRDVLNQSPYDVVNVRFYHMWNEHQYRVDKLWAPNNSSRIFRYLSNGAFLNRQLACGSEPTYVRDFISSRNFWINSGLVMKHLGYVKDEDKKSKYERYSSIDGGKFHNLDHINSIIDENPVLIDWGNFGI